ncbi:hypothetical protein CPC08DRAFT_767677 [Agrocybe pediades]|nr:hypothetical protein CPC08DRAFT_767677 [Agrocybe pediades]
MPFDPATLSLSSDEAINYYFGVSTMPPRLIYRSDHLDRPWKATGLSEGPCGFKVATGVFGTRLNDVWDVEVGPVLLRILDEEGVPWSSVDVVRFVTCYDDDRQTQVKGPVVIWIAIEDLPIHAPGSLTSEILNSTTKILKLLKALDICDVTVEYRASTHIRLRGPPLLPPVLLQDDDQEAALLRKPLTHALSLCICASDRQENQGTMGLYLKMDDKILGLTCHHVLFPTLATSNNEYRFSRSAPRKTVQLLGTKAFSELLPAVQSHFDNANAACASKASEIQLLESRQPVHDVSHSEVIQELERLQDELSKNEKIKKARKELLDYVRRGYGTPEQRVIGQVLYSPKLQFDVGEEGFTEDWALFEIDEDRLKEPTFRGNVIELRTATEVYSPTNFQQLMYPRQNASTEFKYPKDGLLRIQGMLSKEALLKPNMQDQAGEPCLLVIKNGSATGTTIGRATGIFSFVRDSVTGQVSKKWAIYNYGKGFNYFSEGGDSGSVIVNGMGCIGGMLTGGSGHKLGPTIDVTYATPMCWLMDRIKEKYPRAYIHPSGLS